MPVVEFGKLFVHRAADLDDYRSYWVADGSPVLEIDAVREVYAAGNSGIVRSTRVTDDVTYDLVDIPRVDEDWWREGAGHLHLWRDPRGRKHWGFYSSFSPVELPGEVLEFDLSIAVIVVSAPAGLVG